MSNFPPYQYQDQNQWQFAPNVYPSFAPVQTPPQRQEKPIIFRMATCREEVLGFPVDFTGQPLGFMTPDRRTMWIKAFNTDTGCSDVVEYHRSNPTEQNQPQTPTMDSFLELQQLVRQQGEEIAQLRTAPRRRAMREQEVNDDEV